MTNPLYRRAAFGAAALVLAAALLLQALSSAATRSNPQVAVALNGLNGLAREQWAAREFTASAEAGSPPAEAAVKGAALARSAYRSDPLAPKALMISALAEADDAQKGDILTAASRLNRRDLSLQGVVMEQRLASGDYRAVIATLDQLLRVHPEYSADFFPVLQQALVIEGTQDAFANLLDGSSPWHEKFLLRSVRQADARVVLAQIRPSIAVDREVFDQRLIAGLVRQGEFEQAQSVYTYLTSAGGFAIGGDGVTLNWDGRFPPFDWEFLSKRDIRAQESLDGELLEVFVRPGQGDVIARRYLAAGAQPLQISTQLETARAFVPGRVRLSVYCGASKEPIAQLVMREGANRLEVPARPASCPAVRLEISARAFRDDPTLRTNVHRLEVLAAQCEGTCDTPPATDPPPAEAAR
ncbi:MAG: hypothetical protein AAFO28_05410 [Pseudomonadota bacterium]